MLAQAKPYKVEVMNFDSEVYQYTYDDYNEAVTQYSLIKSGARTVCVVMYNRTGGIRFMHECSTKWKELKHPL